MKLKIKYSRKYNLFYPYYKDWIIGGYEPLLYVSACEGSRYVTGFDSYKEAIIKSIEELKRQGYLCENFSTDNLECLNCVLGKKTIEIL